MKDYQLFFDGDLGELKKPTASFKSRIHDLSNSSSDALPKRTCRGLVIESKVIDLDKVYLSLRSIAFSSF